LAGAALLTTIGLGVAAGTPARADAYGQTIQDNIRYSSTGDWQGWEPPVQPEGTVATYPDVTADSAADSIHVDIITTDGMFDIERYSNGTWSTWQKPPQPPYLPSDDPADGAVYQTYSAGLPNGDLDFYQMWDNEIWTITRYADGQWSPDWVETGLQVPYGVFSLAVTAVPSSGGTEEEIIAINNEGTLFHSIIYPDGDFQAWAKPAAVPGGGAEQVAVAGETNGDMEVMAISASGIIWHSIRYADGYWSSWAQPAQPPAGWYATANSYGLNAAADFNGNAQFVIWDLNLTTGYTTVYHDIRYPDGSWQKAWGVVGTPADDTCRGSVAIPTYDPDDTNLHLDALCLF
jgi:hypothetical protein